MPRLIDISLPLRPGMVVWPGDPGMVVERQADMAQGHPLNLTRLCLGSHTGTHLDAPLHFIADGASLDQVPLATLVGPARVVAVAGDSILPEHVAPLAGVERVLFRTRNSDRWAQATAFQEDYVYLSRPAAQRLVELGVQLVGIDYLSVDRCRGGGATHRTLLGAGVVALEGLDLSGVDPGDYQLICLPLRLLGVEGSPVRAVLVAP